jgi:ABC-2 type transport system ATP-binding protein
MGIAMNNTLTAKKTTTLIELLNLCKKYRGRSLPAVNNLSFSIYKGEILGLLGTNGAGKTTTLSLLCGLLKADSGEVLFQGNKDMVTLQKKLGVVPQDIALYSSLTIYENLEFFGRLHKLNSSDCRERIHYWLKKFELEEFKDFQIERLSGGQKRKTNLITALLHNPEFLILDEPTVGVDIQSRKRIMDILIELNQSGLTILYTSHYLEEAERLCHRIIVLDEGKIIAQGSPLELASKHGAEGGLDNAFLQITQKRIL